MHTMLSLTTSPEDTTKKVYTEEWRHFIRGSLPVQYCGLSYLQGGTFNTSGLGLLSLTKNSLSLILTHVIYLKK